MQMNQVSTSEKTFFDRFLHSLAGGSIVLMLSATVALVWANSPWSQSYFDLSHLKIGVIFGGKTYQMGLAHWVKDGLMTIFFFVVGLEIKREVLLGELSNVRKATLPVLAAIGGVVVPACIYFFFNHGGPAASGWGVPMATDIAFALGILALLGDRVPAGLKVFLTALAIVDDIIAVLVIAIFYTAQINMVSLMWAAFFLACFYGVVKIKSRRPILYLIPAVGAWSSFMVSGIHATIAGVLIALLIPVRPTIDPRSYLHKISTALHKLDISGFNKCSPACIIKDQWPLIERIYLTADDMIPSGLFLEKHLHPVQAFVILPLFALFAAGATLSASMFATFPDPISLGIILGLFLGKQIGILGMTCLGKLMGLVDLPEGVRWPHIWGVSMLAGIGFTMSIFISELAYADSFMIDQAKIAIFMASILSGIMGYVTLRASFRFLDFSDKPLTQK